MPLKRNRSESSSKPTTSSSNLSKAVKPAPSAGNDVGEPLLSKIITESSVDELKFGAFLEKCYYCRKKITDSMDVFMYRDFRAFCSIECREIFMAQEQLAYRLQAEEKKKKKDQGPDAGKGKGPATVVWEL